MANRPFVTLRAYVLYVFVLKVQMPQYVIVRERARNERF